MCGRYSLTLEGRALHLYLREVLPALLLKALSEEETARAVDAPGRRKYNIVPASHQPVLRMEEETPVLRPAHWWLLPSWAGKQARWRVNASGERTFGWIGPRKSHFNSRRDTVTNPDNAYWHGLLRNRRCLIPADGFVEWPDDALRPLGQEKRPWHFFLKGDEGKSSGPGNRPFFFAGLYDVARDASGEDFVSYNILTVEPNALLRALPHHRMPAILRDEDVARWLDPGTGADEAAALLRATPEERMDGHAVSLAVNVPANESPRILDPWNPADADPGEPRLL